LLLEQMVTFVGGGVERLRMGSAEEMRVIAYGDEPIS
jgi:hypothetical protein